MKESINKILTECKTNDGGIYPNSKKSDVCLNGMVLNYACYIKSDQDQLKLIIDCLIQEKMPDGGFNCRFNRSCAVHSLLCTNPFGLEGVTEYKCRTYAYRLDELKNDIDSSKEFILYTNFIF